MKVSDGRASINEAPKEYAACGDNLCCKGKSANEGEEFMLGALVSGVEGPEIREEGRELILWHLCYLGYSISSIPKNVMQVVGEVRFSGFV